MWRISQPVGKLISPVVNVSLRKNRSITLVPGQEASNVVVDAAVNPETVCTDAIVRDRAVNVGTQGGKAQSTVVGANVFPKLFRSYGVAS